MADDQLVIQNIDRHILQDMRQNLRAANDIRLALRRLIGLCRKQRPLRTQIRSDADHALTQPLAALISRVKRMQHFLNIQMHRFHPAISFLIILI